MTKANLKNILTAVRDMINRSSEIGIRKAQGAEKRAYNAQTTADAAQTTADAAQTTADNAQTAADNAQTTADNAQTAADNAQTTADNAQTAADNAQTAADNAQTAAENAQTAAENAQTAADLKFQIHQLSESVSVEVGALSAKGSKSFENLNIKNGSIVSVTTSDGLSGKALWTGAQTCQISMQNSVGAQYGLLQINLDSNRKYTITNLSSTVIYRDLVIAYQKVEVPQRVYGPNRGAWLPPYMIVPCLYFTTPYSNSGSKLYCLTVDDNGTLSATEVTE